MHLLFKTVIGTILTVVFFTIQVKSSFGDSRAILDDRADRATRVLRTMATNPRRAIPPGLLRQAKCLAVFPRVSQASFYLGLASGGGLATCRTAEGWSNPSYLRISGLSGGFQFGIRTFALTLVLMDSNAPSMLSRNEFKLNASAGVNLHTGPVGADLRTGVDFRLKSGVYTYAVSTGGAYLGWAISGTSMGTEYESNSVVYGSRVQSPGTLLGTPYRDEPIGRDFIRLLEEIAPVQR